MQSHPYLIQADARRHLLTITFDTVFWDLHVVERFGAECRDSVASFDCSPGQHLVLVDLRNAVLQGQEVYGRLQALIGSATARRIALVASTPLARMQTKRLQVRDNIIMFADIDEAHAWLFDAIREAA